MLWSEIGVIIEAGIIFLMYRKMVEMDTALDLILGDHHLRLRRLEGHVYTDNS